MADMTSVQKLLSIASGPLESGTIEGEAGSRLAQEHVNLLAERNGFLAFESALLVRPVGGPRDVWDWNSAQGWRAGYGDLADGLFFFAEDVFGGQFAIVHDEIVTFDPETRAHLCHALHPRTGRQPGCGLSGQGADGVL